MSLTKIGQENSPPLVVGTKMFILNPCFEYLSIKAICQLLILIEPIEDS